MNDWEDCWDCLHKFPCCYNRILPHKMFSLLNFWSADSILFWVWIRLCDVNFIHKSIRSSGNHNVICLFMIWSDGIAISKSRLSKIFHNLNFNNWPNNCSPELLQKLQRVSVLDIMEQVVQNRRSRRVEFSSSRLLHMFQALTIESHYFEAQNVFLQTVSRCHEKLYFVWLVNKAFLVPFLPLSRRIVHTNSSRLNTADLHESPRSIISIKL